MSIQIAIADAPRLGQLDFNYERSLLKDYDAELSIHNCNTKEEILGELKDKDIICLVSSIFNAEIINELTKCKALMRYGIGVDMIDIEAATQRGILVCNEPHYSVDDVALHTVTMILALTKKVCLLDKEIRRGNWGFQKGYTVNRLTDKTVGMIGFGHIARRVKELLAPFGVKYLVYDPFLSAVAAENSGVTLVSTLEELLGNSDFVSIHCPLTNETRHFIGKEQFNKMKPNAFIINTSRGPIINQKDLVQALEDKKIRGAGLDVYEEEPLKSTDPLCQFDNVILTPHSAFYSEESVLQLRTSIMNQVISVIKGEKPIYLINK